MVEHVPLLFPALPPPTSIPAMEQRIPRGAGAHKYTQERVVKKQSKKKDRSDEQIVSQTVQSTPGNEGHAEEKKKKGFGFKLKSFGSSEATPKRDQKESGSKEARLEKGSAVEPVSPHRKPKEEHSSSSDDKNAEVEKAKAPELFIEKTPSTTSAPEAQVPPKKLPVPPPKRKGSAAPNLSLLATSPRNAEDRPPGTTDSSQEVTTPK